MNSMFRPSSRLVAGFFCLALAAPAFAQQPSTPKGPVPQKPGKTTPNPPAAVDPTDPNAATVAIRKKLKSIVFPKVEFKEVTVREAFDYVATRAKQLDPAKVGVNIALKLPKPGPLVVPPRPGRPDEVPPPPPGGGETRITLTLQDIPLIELIRFIAQLSDLQFRVEPNRVTIMPHSLELETRKWKVDAKAFLAADEVPGKQDKPAVPKLKPAQDFLTESGVVFPPGSLATYDPATSILVVKNILSQLDLVDQVFESDADLKKKLVGIIFPTVEFKDVTVREAIAFVVTRSKQLDPDRQGVNIVLELAPPPPDAPPGQPETKLTLSLKNVPVIEVIKYITNLSDLEYKVEPNAVRVFSK